MEDINRVELRGRLVRNAEMRYTVSGLPLTTFVLATTRTIEAEDGALKEFTDYNRVVAWRKLAEHSVELQKGDACHVVGRLSTRSWQGQDCVKRYMTEVNASSVEPLELRTPGRVEAAR